MTETPPKEKKIRTKMIRAIASSWFLLLLLAVVFTVSSCSGTLFEQDVELPELPYPVDALEPHIDTRTMQVHHGGHHKAYANNLNAALQEMRSNEGE